MSLNEIIPIIGAFTPLNSWGYGSFYIPYKQVGSINLIR